RDYCLIPGVGYGDKTSELRGAAEGYEQVFTKHLWSIFRFLGPNALAWHYQTAAGLYFKAGDENNAHRCLRRAFLFSPFRPKIILSRVQRLIHHTPYVSTHKTHAAWSCCIDTR